MAEEIRTELVADPTKHTAGVNQAKKDAQDFGKQWDTTAKQVQQTSSGASQSMGQVASSARGAASQIAILAKGGGDLENAIAGTSFQLGQMGNALGNMGGAAGGAMSKIAGVAGSLGLYGAVAAATYGVAKDLGLAIHDMFNEGDRARSEAVTKSVRELGAVMEKTTLLARDADFGAVDTSGAEPDWAKKAAPKGKGRGAIARASAPPAFDRAAFDEKERQAAIASADKLTADLIKNEEKQRAAIANLDKIAADNKKALADVAAAEDDRARAARIAKAKAEIAEIDNARAASAAANANFAAAAGVKEGGAGMTLGMALFGQDDPHGNQTLDATNNMAIAVATVGDAAASAAEQLAAVAIGTVMEAAIGPSVKYVETQEQLTRGMFKTEQAFKNAQKAQKGAAAAEKASQLTTGETLKVAVRDTLKAIAIKAALEGAFKLAAAIFPPNPALASSGAALLAVAAAAGGAAAAIGPVTKTRPGGGGVPRDQASATGGGVGVGAKEGPVTQTVNVTVYTLPGTEANGVYEGIERGMNRARRERGKKELAA